MTGKSARHTFTGSPWRKWRQAMQYSRDRIVTSHAGSLPRPDALIAANQARQSGSDIDEARFQTQLQSAVVDVVRRQQDL
jgi:5-methyltetrahydropteroyltriglutamate--homocysteine methyltransferase